MMKAIYKYIFLWPNGDIHLYIAHTIFEVVTAIETLGYNTANAKVIKRLALPKDFKEVNTIVVASVTKELSGVVFK